MTAMMSQQALSDAVQVLQTQVGTLTDELNKVVPMMAATIEAEFAKTQTACANTKAKSVALDAKLKVELIPYIENKTVMRAEQLISVGQQMTAANYDDKIIETQ